jgi:protein-L-isoaspartate(D-aspartate) O-methyltransferase
VLDVGAGTGYSSAVLARLAATVIALEADTALAKRAEGLLGGVGAGAVKLVVGELSAGWAPEGPYDAIVVEGAVAVTPEALLDQLKDGGRLVAIAGNGRTGRATVWRRDGATFGAVAAFDANADVLPGFEKASAFAF